MTPEDRSRFPPMDVILRNQATARIRPLLPTDGEALGDFYEAIPREDFRFYCPHPLDRPHALHNAAKADSPLEVVLVIETDKRAIGGYAWFRWEKESSPTSGFGICLRKDLQNCGAGRALMTRIMEIAKAIGPSVMSLTAQQANQRAVTLYTSMGFKIVREQMRPDHFMPGFPAEPEYAMERSVR